MKYHSWRDMFPAARLQNSWKRFNETYQPRVDSVLEGFNQYLFSSIDAERLGDIALLSSKTSDMDKQRFNGTYRPGVDSVLEGINQLRPLCALGSVLEHERKKSMNDRSDLTYKMEIILEPNTTKKWLNSDGKILSLWLYDLSLIKINDGNNDG
ncbi:hypothetical protein Sjap_020452 [Stephania japonica]|uniref:Uncharacterized protein n=1 Tax=Stephania japonica TaxID=461633 RepID=A0AAP0HVK9_9MAGN